MLNIILLVVSTMVMITSCTETGYSRKNPDEKQPTANKKTTFTTGYADVNGIQMYYEIYGNGQPLVLIHGGGSTITSTFGRVIPVLSKNRMLIAVELQGHGRTGDRPAPISFEQDADDVAALLKKLNIVQADILGFSNGGNTALQLAIRHPDVCKKIIAGSVLLKRNGTSARFWEFMKAGTFAQMPQQYKDAFLQVNPDTSKLLNLFRKCAYRMNNFKDVADEQIQSIKAPVLLVNGDQDVASSEHIVAISKLIPNCRLAIVPGGHGAYIGEITTLNTNVNTYAYFVSVIDQFLQETTLPIPQ